MTEKTNFRPFSLVMRFLRTRLRVWTAFIGSELLVSGFCPSSGFLDTVRFVGENCHFPLYNSSTLRMFPHSFHCIFSYYITHNQPSVSCCCCYMTRIFLWLAHSKGPNRAFAPFRHMRKKYNDFLNLFSFYVTSEGFRARSTKNTVFWNVTPCAFSKILRFGGK